MSEDSEDPMSTGNDIWVYAEVKVRVPKPRKKPRSVEAWKELVEKALADAPVRVHYASEETADVPEAGVS